MSKIIINKEEQEFCKLCIVYLKFREIEFTKNTITLDEKFYNSLGETDLVEKINLGAKIFNKIYQSFLISFRR